MIRLDTRESDSDSNIDLTLVYTHAMWDVHCDALSHYGSYHLPCSIRIAKGRTLSHQKQTSAFEYERANLDIARRSTTSSLEDEVHKRGFPSVPMVEGGNQKTLGNESQPNKTVADVGIEKKTTEQEKRLQLRKICSPQGSRYRIKGRFLGMRWCRR